MALFGIPDVRIAGIAAAVPATVVSNENLEILSDKERKLLPRATGILYRRIASAGVCTSDLCLASAEKLLHTLHWPAGSINLLVFVSQTPDYLLPATAPILQHRLGLPTSCVAFDVNLGCSGYVYGLSIAASMLRQLGGGRGLLLVGDISSRYVSPRDKSTLPVFSDAGSATALEYAAGSKPMYFNLKTDGRGYKAIMIPDGGCRNPFSSRSLNEKEAGEGIVRNRTHVILNGIDIFNFSVREAPESVQELLAHLNIDTGDVDYFIFHQANKLINDTIRMRLKLPEDKVPMSLRDYGNTSSATIPVTMVACLTGQLAHPSKIVLSGFGVGLSWGAAFIDSPGMKVLPLIEYTADSTAGEL